MLLTPWTPRRTKLAGLLVDEKAVKRESTGTQPSPSWQCSMQTRKSSWNQQNCRAQATDPRNHELNAPLLFNVPEMWVWFVTQTKLTDTLCKRWLLPVTLWLRTRGANYPLVQDSSWRLTEKQAGDPGILIHQQAPFKQSWLPPTLTSDTFTSFFSREHDRLLSAFRRVWPVAVQKQNQRLRLF